jgi:hypothetical protein
MADARKATIVGGARSDRPGRQFAATTVQTVWFPVWSARAGLGLCSWRMRMPSRLADHNHRGARWVIPRKP